MALEPQFLSKLLLKVSNPKLTAIRKTHVNLLELSTPQHTFHGFPKGRRASSLQAPPPPYVISHSRTSASSASPAVTITQKLAWPWEQRWRFIDANKALLEHVGFFAMFTSSKQIHAAPTLRMLHNMSEVPCFFAGCRLNCQNCLLRVRSKYCKLL